MFKIKGYLKKFWYLILACICLLFVQAQTELTLPDYMSDIVSVGIQAGGFASPVSDVLTEETYQHLLLFVDQKDQKTVKKDYKKVSKVDQDIIDTFPKAKGKTVYQLKDLSSDEDVLCEAKLKMFKPWAIAMCILAAMIFYGFTSFFSWLYRFSWGSIFLNLNVCFSLFLIYVGCFLWLFAALFIYLKRRALKKRTYSYQKFKYLDGFVRIVIDILAILMIGMLFVLKMNNLSSLLSFSGYFILITLFTTIINTKIPLIKNPIKKKIAVIVSVAVFVGVYFLYNEIDFSKLDKQEMTITLPKNKRIDENNSNLLVDTTTFIQKIGKDKDDGEVIYSFEGYYQCLNTFVSKNIFKELVLERERQTRMPSDKEIDQIVEEKGSWRSDEIGYNTYQNVLKKFKKRKSMYFDQVVEIGHYQLGIKGKKVLIVYNEDIDDFYHHYINFIQK